MQTETVHRIVLRPSAVLLFALAAQAASAQTWNYDSVRKGGRGKSGGEVAHGTATLEEKDGKATLRIVGAGDDLCVRGDLPATVVRSADTTTIEPQSTVSGCEPSASSSATTARAASAKSSAARAGSRARPTTA